MTMSFVWLIPAALWGLAAVTVPILVHLLTRQERRSIPFPSLRFLTATRLVALRHRRIHDWPLLLVRAAIVATAVAALAGPLLITPQRERAWNARTARAMILTGAPDEARIPKDEIESAFASRVIPASPRIADTVRSAVEWLSTQPPAARELVVVGDVRVGMLEEADLAAVPAHVGIRFLPDTVSTPEPVVDVPILVAAEAEPRLKNAAARRDGESVEERRVQLNPRETIVSAASGSTDGGGSRPAHRLEVNATGPDRPVADAALAALLSEGVVADAAGARHVIVQWPGRDEPSSEASREYVAQTFRSAGQPGGRPEGLQYIGSQNTRQPAWMRAVLERVDMDGDVVGDALIVRLPGRVTGADAVATLRRIASAAFDDPTLPLEPQRIVAGDLSRWSRPPGVTPDAIRQEEGDRRVLWALALALLALEAVLRRSTTRTAAADVPIEEESRVA
jgi:hypothetical protein